MYYYSNESASLSKKISYQYDANKRFTLQIAQGYNKGEIVSVDSLTTNYNEIGLKQNSIRTISYYYNPIPYRNTLLDTLFYDNRNFLVSKESYLQNGKKSPHELTRFSGHNALGKPTKINYLRWFTRYIGNDWSRDTSYYTGEYVENLTYLNDSIIKTYQMSYYDPQYDPYIAYAFNQYENCSQIISNLDTPSKTEAIINIYPNPVQDALYIRFSDETLLNFAYDVVDVSGRKILSGLGNKNADFNINVQNIPSGLYILKIAALDKFFVKKFMIQR
jgi:hypothetical protein